jgi:hypothetical protein
MRDAIVEHAMTIRSAYILCWTLILLLGSAFGADVHRGSTTVRHADHPAAHQHMQIQSPLT